MFTVCSILTPLSTVFVKTPYSERLYENSLVTVSEPTGVSLKSLRMLLEEICYAYHVVRAR